MPGTGCALEWEKSDCPAISRLAYCASAWDLPPSLSYREPVHLWRCENCRTLQSHYVDEQAKLDWPCLAVTERISCMFRQLSLSPLAVGGAHS